MLIASHHPTALTPLALLSDPPQGPQSLLVWNKARKERDWDSFVCSSELSPWWDTVETQTQSWQSTGWTFLQHYTYQHIKNTLHICKRWKLLGKWKMSAHIGASSVWKPLFPRTAYINKKGVRIWALPLAGNTFCLSNSDILLVKGSVMPDDALMSHSASH